MNHPTSAAPTGQVASACRALIKHPALPGAEHRPAAPIPQAVRQAGVRFRERIYTPAVTLGTFLLQVLDPDHSCRQAVARLLAHRAAQGLAPCSADTGVYGPTRRRLPEEALHERTRRTGKQLMDKAEGEWLWKGRRVKVVDGAGLSMPATPANQRAYPQSAKIPAGVGFPLLRCVGVFSRAVGTVLEAARGRLHGPSTGAVSLFRIREQVLEPGDVLLGDRR